MQKSKNKMRTTVYSLTNKKSCDLSFCTVISHYCNDYTETQFTQHEQYKPVHNKNAITDAGSRFTHHHDHGDADLFHLVSESIRIQPQHLAASVVVEVHDL